MNKNFDLAGRQRRHNYFLERKRDKKRLEYSGDNRYLPAQNEIVFSYKGVILRKANNIYTIDKQIRISGVDESKVDGVWNNGPLLQNAIDVMLTSAKPERLAEVRKAHFNWTCPRCKLTRLYEREYEEGHDVGYPVYYCKYCGFSTPLSEVEPAGDETFR